MQDNGFTFSFEDDSATVIEAGHQLTTEFKLTKDDGSQIAIDIDTYNPSESPVTGDECVINGFTIF